MITMTDYAKRRAQLLRTIEPDGVVIVPAASERIRNGDVHYPFRQDSDFYYLTGFPEPDAVMVLMPYRSQVEYILFSRPRDPEQEQWDGRRIGQQEAKRHFLADHAYDINQFDGWLSTLLKSKRHLYYSVGYHSQWDKRIIRLLRSVRGVTLCEALPLIHELRVIKTPAEIALIQEAVNITVDAHTSAIMACEPGMNECELEAVLSYEFKSRGAMHPAYPHIVASGKHATTLHYNDNNKRIGQDELVLIDAGAEYRCYAADITRTFPANGHFSPEQRAIYEIVLSAQLAGIRAVKPGARWASIQEVVVRVIVEGLKELGILKGRVSDLIEKKAYLPFYMHGSGHWLGLDVHDAGRYQEKGKPRSLKPGMVLTVEPGIYISALPGVAKRWHYMGVRIEDDVLVTPNGCRVLSAQLPKTVDELEAMMGT
jgi:Xaa-Pro aminopeptidase